MNVSFQNNIRYKALLLWGCLVLSIPGYAQKTISINLAPVDGVDITPENIFNYQVQSTFQPTNALIKGTVRYRNSNQNFSYTFTTMLHPGLNMISGGLVHPQWQFSSGALQELFLTYGKLPEGTVEYCVTVTPNYKPGAGEPSTVNDAEECLYHQQEDILLIDLVDPENNAKIHEYNPNLSWAANCSFANELSYRIRVTDMKQGQNPQSAVSRNNPVYDESNLMQNSVIYPIYAKPLVVNQPYAWTVDAYFKGILIGGAEAWKFTIIEDTLLQAAPNNQSYFEFEKHNNDTRVMAMGELKLKYRADYAKDTLFLKLTGSDDKEIKLPVNNVPLTPGDNRFSVVFTDQVALKDGGKYIMTITTKRKRTFTVPFTYTNTLFTK